MLEVLKPFGFIQSYVVGSKLF